MTILETSDSGTLSVKNSIDDICEDGWRACIGSDQPYLDPRHLRVLEKSGMVGEEAGILPQYLSLNDAGGALTAAVPVFLKTHSRGELGVDWGLPLAHERVAGPYYPKLMVEVPLTPWPGSRLLIADGQDYDVVRRTLFAGLDILAKTTGARSVQITYASLDDQTAAVDHGYLPAETTTFTWQSRGEQDFEEFKAAMSKRGRYRLRSEYENRVADGLVIKRLDGSELTSDLVSEIYQQYCGVFEQHNHAEWLNRDYFDQLISTMPDALEFLAVWEDDHPIAGLLCFRGSKTISAQHWVSKERQQGHLFALMFHSYRDAIQRGYKAVDYGTIGAHKPYRAALPKTLYHALKFADAPFHSMAETVLKKRTQANDVEFEKLAERSPYKNKTNRPE